MTHKPQNSRYTVLKVRLRRKTKDVWHLGQILLALVIALASLAAFQVRLCRVVHPGRGVIECLRPYVERR